MEFDAARMMALELMGAHGVGDWVFGWNRRRRSLGLCRYDVKRIELSVHFVRGNGEGAVRDTILHEIAHALSGSAAGHGAVWRAACERLGCRARRCDGEALMPAGKWRAACPGCGKGYERHRRPRRRARYWCRACGPERGVIRFAVGG